MGRVERNWPKVQIRSSLTWTFSATAGMGRSRPTRTRHRPVSAAGLRVSASLLDSILRAARSQPPPSTLRTARRLRIRRR
ncbi:hypothetical protein [Streptomyces sp. NPDC005244]|uniref:hypothetical protein n=1 Tax=Streptomyces sp. NPDC005244 TaxID=3364708 RepID=UPI0036C1D86C